MASINASTSGGGGIITTADATGNLDIQSGGSTVVAVTSAGVAVTGTLAATGAVSGTTGTFTSTLGVTGAITGSSTVAGSTGILYPLTSGTAVASTSGTSIDFTSIPSWVKRITVMFNEVSANGTSIIQIQIGTSGGIQTTGYQGTGFTTNTTLTAMSTGFLLSGVWASTYSKSGSAILSLLDSSTGRWAYSSATSLNTAATGVGVAQDTGGGGKTLSGTLDRVRITTVNGTDTFDAGSVNILYE